MTAPQTLAFAIIGGAILLFAWGRFRYDLIALAALLAGIVTGDVPMKEAFTGFTSEVVIIIASALIISAAIARSGVIEWAVGPTLSRLKRPTTQVPALAGTTALLSMLTKNVGALAIMMPVALRISRQSETSASSLLMPMAFMSLLGGLVTLVGTSTNIIASDVRAQMLGQPFAMYDFAPVGLILTALGLLYMVVGWRLLPRHRQGRAALSEATADASWSTEARLPDPLPETLRTVGDLKLADDNVTISALVIGKRRKQRPTSRMLLAPGASLVLEGDDEALDRLFGRLPLEHVRKEAPAKEEPAEETRTVEAVVQPGSVLIGTTAARARLQDDYGVQLMGVGRGNEQIAQRLRDIKLRAGDLLILRAGETTLPSTMSTLGVLPLAERMVKLGDRRRRFLPAAILAVAMLLVGFKLIPIAEAFFGAAVLMLIFGSISLREAYGSLEPEVLILIGALTPLSEAVHRTGGTELIAQAMAAPLGHVPAMIALGAVMLTAMLLSPFLHNAPTVLMMAPISVLLARSLHLSPDPFLMAVATGAGCDFLTPIGHQCNTLVRGPGGYRFGDYWRLGIPLSLLVVLVGTPLINFFWPMG